MKVTNIKWEVDDERDLELLPKEIEIPNDLDERAIGDYISDLTDYLHRGFVLINNEEYEYEIFLNDLDGGNLVGTNGDVSFKTEKEAIKDAKDYINKHLMYEYRRKEQDFRIVIYKIID